jgi:recombination protein RecT
MPDGRPATPATSPRSTASAPFAAQCAQRGLELAADEVFVLAHWITDRDLPRRFDVPFLVARMPEGQTPVADESEQFEPVWVRPADALERHAAGSSSSSSRPSARCSACRPLPTWTRCCSLRRDEQPLWTSCPRAGLLAARKRATWSTSIRMANWPWSAPTGRSCTTLDWQTERPVPLLRNVMRLTAPNPGVMTGPGTNSYLVGDPATGFIAIDPGPADPCTWSACGAQRAATSA